MKDAKERVSGAVKKDWEPRLIEARHLGQHARTGAMIGIIADGIVCGRPGRRLPEAERWDQTGWQDLKGVPWDLRPTDVSAPKTQGKNRVIQTERRSAPRRSARGKSNSSSTSISVRGGRDGAISQENSRERHSSKIILCSQEGCE